MGPIVKGYEYDTFFNTLRVFFLFFSYFFSFLFFLFLFFFLFFFLLLKKGAGLPGPPWDPGPYKNYRVYRPLHGPVFNVMLAKSNENMKI